MKFTDEQIAADVEAGRSGFEAILRRPFASKFLTLPTLRRYYAWRAAMASQRHLTA